MLARVVAPDVSLLLCAYVRAALAPWATSFPDLFVGTVKPSTSRPWVVTFRRDGGPVVWPQEVTRVGCNVWAPTEHALMNATDGLASLVLSHLQVAADGVQIAGVDAFTSPLFIPDDSESAHAYFTFEVVTTGTPA